MLSRTIGLSLATVIVVMVATVIPAVVLNDLEALLAVTIWLNLSRMFIWLLQLFSSCSLNFSFLQSIV